MEGSNWYHNFKLRSVREGVSNVLLTCTAYTSGLFGVVVDSPMPDYFPSPSSYSVNSEGKNSASRRKESGELSTLASN